MPTFQIQNSNGSTSPVGHNEFYEILNSGKGYLYYKQGGQHIALLPTEKNRELVDFCNQADRAEMNKSFFANRCRDEKGRVCRYQHDENGQIIRDLHGNAIYAKCGDCPRNGWQTGKRENCCIRNYCKTKDCVYCPYPRECHAYHSLEWLMADKKNGEDTEDGGLPIVSPDMDVLTVLVSAESKAELIDALNKLPADEQKLIRAHYWESQSLNAYAKANSVSATKVKYVHKRAIERLKSKLKKLF